MKLSEIIKQAGDMEILSLEEAGKAVRALMEVNDGRITQAVQFCMVDHTNIPAFKRLKYNFAFKPGMEEKTEKAKQILQKLGIKFSILKRVGHINALRTFGEMECGVAFDIDPRIYVGCYSNSDDPIYWHARQLALARKARSRQMCNCDKPEVYHSAEGDSCLKCGKLLKGN